MSNSPCLCVSVIEKICGESVSSAARNRCLRFGIRGFAAHGFAFIPELFAARQGQLAFCPSMLKVNARRDQGQPLLLGFADQLAQLVFMDQQFAGPQRFMIKDVAMLVGTY